MRKKVHGSRRAKTQPISIYPDQLKFAHERANAARSGLSGYFQALLEYDRRHNILPDALTLGFTKQEAA